MSRLLWGVAAAIVVVGVISACTESPPAEVDHDNGGAGSGEGGDGDGGGANIDRSACDAYLACVAAAQLENFPGIETTYGPAGSCYVDSTPEQCASACEMALEVLAGAYPNEPACNEDPPGPECSYMGQATAPTDCMGACEILFCCAEPRCDGLAASDRSAFVADCTASCSTMPGVGNIADGSECDQTVATLRQLSSNFVDDCDNGL